MEVISRKIYSLECYTQTTVADNEVHFQECLIEWKEVLSKRGLNINLWKIDGGTRTDRNSFVYVGGAEAEIRSRIQAGANAWWKMKWQIDIISRKSSKERCLVREPHVPAYVCDMGTISMTENNKRKSQFAKNNWVKRIHLHPWTGAVVCGRAISTVFVSL